MSIVKKPASKDANKVTSVNKFIESAPDGDQKRKADGANDDGGVQITLRLTNDQLARIGAVAKRQGIPRASYIKRCIFVMLEKDELPA